MRQKNEPHGARSSCYSIAWLFCAGGIKDFIRVAFNEAVEQLTVWHSVTTGEFIETARDGFLYAIGKGVVDLVGHGRRLF